MTHVAMSPLARPELRSLLVHPGVEMKAKSGSPPFLHGQKWRIDLILTASLAARALSRL